jgi:hypothetical protein
MTMTEEEKPQIDMDLVRRSAEVRAETFHAIGRFIFQFSQLEFSIRFALGAYLGLPDDYFDAVTGPYDFRMLCAVTSKARQLKYPAQKDEIEKLFNECLELNNSRVQIAHGVWTEGLGDDWTVRHWSRQTLDAKHYPYSVAQLLTLGGKAQELLQRVIGFKAASVPEEPASTGSPAP